MTFTIRPYRPEDRLEYVEMAERRKAQDPCQYRWLDPDFPLHFLTLVVERDGKLVAGGTGRICAELFLTMDPDATTPAEKWEIIKMLLEESRDGAKTAGLHELFLNIPQGLKRYAERLKTVPNVYFDDRFHLILAAHPGPE